MHDHATTGAADGEEHLLTITVLHRSFALSIFHFFSSVEHHAQIDRGGENMIEETEEMLLGFLEQVWLCLYHYWND